MSQQDYESKLQSINELKDEDIKIPSMPVYAAVQEAEDLFHWCQADMEKLKKAGLNWSLVKELPVRAGACRYAQSIWSKESQTKEDARKKWNEKSPAAFDLRDTMVHHFYHAFRKHDDLIARVRKIDEGSSYADMIQDLNDIGVLGKDNTKLLESVGIDIGLLDECLETADEMANLLGIMNGEAAGDVDAKNMRDRAYTFMKLAVDEIRHHGQYVFWRDEDRKKGYVSKYNKKKRKNPVSKAIEEESK